VVVPELREVFLGEWEGGTFSIRLAERDPLMLRAMREQRWDLLPGAESMDVFAQRLRLGLERILAATPDGAAAVAFLHGGVIGELCRQATGSEPFAFIHADNASVTRLVVRANGRRLLRSFNDTSHLAHVSRA
jgi:probable phosphoglycerate mutase